MNSILKRLLIILIILILGVIFMPSHFQKGGVSDIYYFLIPLTLYVCSFIWILPINYLSWIERILLSIFVPFIALIISTLFLMELFINWRYSDKTWFLWENSERIITNSVYYGVTFFLIVGMVEVYTKLRIRKL